MGEPLCLAFSFCNTPWCLTSSSFYSNCSLVVAKPNGSHFLSKDYCWVSSDVTQLPFLVFWSHLATSRWVHGKGGVIIKALRTTETLLCRQNGCKRISNGIKNPLHMLHFNPETTIFITVCLSSSHISFLSENELQFLWNAPPLDDEIIRGNFSTFSCDSKLGWRRRNVTFSRDPRAYAKFPGKTMTH